MNPERKIDKAAVLTMARQVNLPIADARAAELVPLLQNVFQMLDRLEPQDLGEVSPSFSFKAKWE